MIYKILIEQNGSLLFWAKQSNVSLKQTKEIIDALQLEHGCCCALETVSE